MKILVLFYVSMLWAVVAGVIPWALFAFLVALLAVPVAAVFLRIKLSPAYKARCAARLAQNGWMRGWL